MRRYSKGMAAAMGRYLDAIAALRARRGATSSSDPIEPIEPISAVRPIPRVEKSRGFDEEA